MLQTAPQFMIKFLVATRVPHSLRRSSLLIASGEQNISLDDRRTYSGLYASSWTLRRSQSKCNTSRPGISLGRTGFVVQGGSDPHLRGAVMSSGGNVRLTRSSHDRLELRVVL